MILELEFLDNLSRQPRWNSTFAQKNVTRKNDKRKKPMIGIDKAHFKKKCGSTMHSFAA